MTLSLPSETLDAELYSYPAHVQERRTSIDKELLQQIDNFLQGLVCEGSSLLLLLLLPMRKNVSKNMTFLSPGHTHTSQVSCFSHCPTHFFCARELGVDGGGVWGSKDSGLSGGHPSHLAVSALLLPT
ncbi:uncharacterized protein ACWYII_044802 isoform 1-T1 [Salvelinus alpinus]